jgi:hypothetical protein
MKLALAAPLALALVGCVTVHAPSVGVARASIGQTVNVGGPKVTPLAVLEDSRCPMNARCVWAGQVRLSVRITLGTRSEVREIISNKPIPVADGQLELVEVTPDRVAGGKPFPTRDYRFGFKFAGGI